MRSVKRSLILFLSSALLLLLWQLASVLLDSQILLPGLGPVFSALNDLVRWKPFSANVFATILRALQSFTIIVASATVVGLLGGKFPLFSLALRPFVTVLKAIPVMSIILLAFIWFTSGTVPLFSAFLMGFPVMYVQIEGGVKQMDKSLNEMCRLYDIRGWDKLVHYTLPSLLPFFIIGSRASLSMVWKVVIAAEVLTVPRYGVGARMQLSQVQLETDQVLSWTLMAILLTAVFDLLFDGLVWSLGKLKKHVDARSALCDSNP